MQSGEEGDHMGSGEEGDHMGSGEEGDHMGSPLRLYVHRSECLFFGVDEVFV